MPERPVEYRRGNAVVVRFPTGTEHPGVIANLPGETYVDSYGTTCRVPQGKYRVRYWANGLDYHVTVKPDRLTPGVV